MTFFPVCWPWKRLKLLFGSALPHHKHKLIQDFRLHSKLNSHEPSRLTDAILSLLCGKNNLKTV